MKRTILALILTVAATHAEQLAIRITGQAQPNCWSIDDIVANVTRGLKSDREKALALHRFGMAHFIHFNGPIEEREEYVTDPLKLIGVYGYALCGNNSDAMAAHYNRAGMKARTRSLSAHAVPEIWFENKWNYIDTDMFGYVFLDDGKTIASVDELIRDPDLFVRQKNPPDPYYPFDEKPDMASVFRRAKAHTNYHPYANAHMMNLALRTGESATLYYRPRNRYLLTTIYPPDLGIVYRDYWTLGPVRRGSLAWCDEKPATYGNGLIEYAPDLRSEAFRKENPAQRGVIAGRDKQSPPLAAQPGERGSVEIEMSYPWVIAGLQNDLTDFDDDTDGAVVSGLYWRLDAAGENRILVSNDNGLSWKSVWENRHLGAVPFQVDLTRYAKGRYSYRVRFEFSGRAGLENLKFKTWVALSPMALPRVVSGHNRFEIATAPRRTYYHESRWEKGVDLEGQQGDRSDVLTFRLGPNGPVEETRISVMVRNADLRRPASLALELSENGGAAWHELERFEQNPEHDMSHMWFNHAIRGRPIEGSSARLRLTVANGQLEKVIANSAVRGEPQSASALRVTHTWREGGEPKSFSRTFAPDAARRAYEVDVKAAKLLNESLKIEALPAAAR